MASSPRRPARSRSNGASTTMPPSAQEAMYYFTANANPPPSGPRNGPRPPYRRDGQSFRRFGVHERPLLRQKQEASGLGLFSNPAAKDKFRSTENMTDSDEDEMQESEDEPERPTKKLRTDIVDSPSSLGTPKWSNPDPYTALPAPEDAGGKRVDVVKLIRKAKIDDADALANSIADNADFISFDGVDDFFPDAPTGPRADRGGEQLGKRSRDDENARPRPPGGYHKRRGDGLVLPSWQGSRHGTSTPWLSAQRSTDVAAAVLHKEIIDFYEWVRPQAYEAEVRADVLQRLNLEFNRFEPGRLMAFGSYAAGLYLPTGDMDLVFLRNNFKPGSFGPNGLPPPPPKRMLYRFADIIRGSNLAHPGSVNMILFAKVPIIKFVERLSGLKIDLSFNNDSGIVANDTFQKWKAAYPAMPIVVSVVKHFLMIRGLNDVAVGGLGGFSIICLVTSLIQHLPFAVSPTNLGQVVVEFFNLYGNLLDKETVALRLDPPGYTDKTSYKPHVFNRDKPNRLTIIDPNRPENNISGGTTEIDTIFEAFATAHESLQSRLAEYEERATTGCYSFLEDILGGDFGSYEEQRKTMKDLHFGLTGMDYLTGASRLPPPPPPATKTQPPPPPPPDLPLPPQQGPKNQSRISREQEKGVKHLLPARPAAATNLFSSRPTPTSLPSTSFGAMTTPTQGFDVSTTADTSTSDSRSKARRRAERLRMARPDIAKQVPSTIKEAHAVVLGGYKDANDLQRDMEQRLKHLNETTVMR